MRHAAPGGFNTAAPRLAYIQKERSMSQDYVYLIGVARDGCHKIGWSTDPEQRLYHLRLREKDRGLRLLHAARTVDGFWLEQYLHVAFAHRRVRGEWFRLSDDDVATFGKVGPADAPAGLPGEVTGLFGMNDSLGSRGAAGHLEYRRLEKILEREADSLAGALAAGGAGAPDPLEWASRSPAADRRRLLKMAAMKLRQEAFCAEDRVRLLSHPGGASLLPAAQATARHIREQEGRLTEMIGTQP
jgi:hypothetical protein